MQTLRCAVLALAVIASKASTDVYELSLTDKEDLLDAHNRVRASYGACPLVWDADLASDANNDPLIAQCEVSSGDVEGQVHATEWLNSLSDLNMDKFTDIWLAQESSYNSAMPISAMTSAYREFALMVWKATAKVGCGVCYVNQDGGLPVQIICRYDVKSGSFADNLGSSGDHCDLCAGVTCDQTGPCLASGSCNNITGACVYRDKADDTPCTEVGVEGKCLNGGCKPLDKCENVTCIATDQCHLPGVCDTQTGVCSVQVYDADLAKDLDPGNLGACDDGNYYTVNDTCVNGECVGVNLCQGVVCTGTSSNECRYRDTCDPHTGTCIDGSYIQEGTPCDDGDSATVNDTCTAGTCAGLDLCGGKVCVTNEPCYNFDGVCNVNTGACEYEMKPDNHTCSDNNANTVEDRCKQGACIGVDRCAGVVCDDDPCLNEICDSSSGLCVATAPASGDGGVSNNPKCVTCVGVVCPDRGQCALQVSCDPATGTCPLANKTDNTVCDDGDDNTVEDKCTNGVCAGHNRCENVQCVAVDDCHKAGVCNMTTGQCSNPVLDDGTQCDDGDSSTDTDTCTSGVCSGKPRCMQTTCLVPTTEKHPECKLARCEQNQCEIKNRPSGTVCDDENPDTVNDTCTHNGACEGIDLCATVKCPAASDCYQPGTCDSQTGLCSVVFNNNIACDDGEPITVNDTCFEGSCTGVDRQLCKDVKCDSPPVCQAQGTCNPIDGTCAYKVKRDGSACTDGNDLTTDDKCKSGDCVGVPLCTGVVCQAVSQCHDKGVCDPNTGLCSEPTLANGTACDDRNNKTKNDVCMGGTCRGQDLCSNVRCNDTDYCKIRRCDEDTGSCVVESWRTDGTNCSRAGDVCLQGECVDLCKDVKCHAESIVCEELGKCNPLTGKCQRILKPEGTPCDDGDTATGPDKCDGKAKCVGPDICENVICPVPTQCQEPGVCNPAWAPDGELCTRPKKQDGTPCDDGNPQTTESCSNGECVVEKTCEITYRPTGTAQCEQGYSGGNDTAKGGYGFTPEGNLYIYNDCREEFVIEATGETVRCGYLGEHVGYTECKLLQRMTYKECLPDFVCSTCEPLDSCHEAGICHPSTGECSNPIVPDGTICDDGNNNTVADKCLQGTCKGHEKQPGCFKASRWAPSRECEHDDAACGWGSNVWDTMEECCRPGKGHVTGCAPAPAGPEECWRAGVWWPNQDCVRDDDACDWGMGTHVFGSYEACCKKDAAFKCGCNAIPETKTCYTKRTSDFPKRDCVEVEVTGDKTCEEAGFSDSRDACCKASFGKDGCCLGCKTLDVVLLIDGSGSMKQSFTKHPMGFNALCAMLEDWIDVLPLTGEAAGKATMGNMNGGVRVGIVQFSTSTDKRNKQFGISIETPAKYTTTTGGRLSGDKSQLLLDVKWHKANFIGKGTKIKPGLIDAANMFEDIDRPRALIIISDGAIFDLDELESTRTELDRKNVVVFGVVVRRKKSHTKVDLEAEDSLRHILSKPTSSHFFNLEIDDVPSKVLNGICDPKSQWGAYIKPVAPFTVPSGVVAQPGVFSPQQPTATGHGDVYFPNKLVYPFSDLNCSDLHHGKSCGAVTACDLSIEGSTVLVGTGFDAITDMLDCTECRNLGIQSTYRAATGMLVMTGTATLERYTQAIASVAFIVESTQCGDVASREFTFAYGRGFGTTAGNHTYQYYADKDVKWDAAQEKCAKMVDLGRKGYLATITSAAESEALKRLAGGQGWIGASDAAKEGEWTWVAGPEGCTPGANCDLKLADWAKTGEAGVTGDIGTLFYSTTTGNVSFNNWMAGEPDNSKNQCGGSCGNPAGEDFGHFKWPSGQWEDFAMNQMMIDGYLCEWGGVQDDDVCIDNVLGSRTYTCANTTTAPVDECDNNEPPVTSQGGCATGWIVADDFAGTMTREKCADTCLTTKGALHDFCKDGPDQQCICLAAQVKQCRCADPDLMTGEYCSSVDPLPSGLHQCFEPIAELAGDWFSSNPDYSGVPPAVEGDGDDQFVCHRYQREQGTWESLGKGQCRDSSWRYFARYTKQNLALDGCMALCEQTADCHSIHFQEPKTPAATSMCTINAVQAGSCLGGQRHCSAQQTKPRGCKSCGCTTLMNGASEQDNVVCVNDGVCFPPNSAGECAAPAKVCSRKPEGRVTVGKGKSVQNVIKAIAGGCRKSTKFVKLSFICPATACEKKCTTIFSFLKICATTCPKTESLLKAAGCTLYTSFTTKKAKRSFAALEDAEVSDDVVVGFDLDLSDDEAEAAFNKLAETTAKASSSQDASVFGADAAFVSQLQAVGVTDAGRALPASKKSFGSAAPGPSDDDDSGLSTGAMVAMALTLGVGAAFLGLFVFKRKEKVSWGDVAVPDGAANDSTQAGIQYSDLAKFNITEMEPAVLGASMRTSNSKSSYSPRDGEPTLLL
ncbi:Halomucin [Diplonema papillatum]|nr:Halomucin [Diplonema papillatum]